MARDWKPRQTPRPTSLTEIARRYHAAAVALAQSLGLSVPEVLSQHRESVTAIFIESGRCDLRLPAAVKLPPLAAPPHAPAIPADAPVAQVHGQVSHETRLAQEAMDPADIVPDPPTNGRLPAEAPLTADEVNALLELGRSVGLDLQAFGHDMRRVLGLAEGTKITKKRLRTSMRRPQYETAWQAYSDRLKQQVEQGLAEPEDVPDHAPPAPEQGTPERLPTVEPSHGRTNGAPVSGARPPARPPNGQAEPSLEERLRWGALSRRSMKAGLSPSVWTTLREVGDYVAAARVIGALEQATPTTGEG